jgi:hypothetical protein
MATTTPNYGWPVPTSTDYVKDGATAIEALGDAIDATVFGLGSAGMSLVKTQTIGTAVTSVTVTDAFSATYDSYKIIVSGGAANTATDINLQLGASTTGYYMGRIGVAYSGAGTSADNRNNAASWTGGVGRGATTGLNLVADLLSPFLAKTTVIASHYINQDTAGVGGVYAGFHNVSTSYTDFTLATGGATLTGGTIKVYGYKN